MEDPKNKWDLKQMGIGGGSVIGVLFLFQSQGLSILNSKQNQSIDAITKSQITQSQVVIEKTIANAQRIQRLEDTVTNLNKKIDEGFESIRLQIRGEVANLSSIMSIGTKDRYTKSQHDSYARSVESRLERNEREISEIRRKLDRTDK